MSMFKEISSKETTSLESKSEIIRPDMPFSVDATEGFRHDSENIFKAALKRFGLLEGSFEKKDADFDEAKDSSDHSEYLEKGEDGKYYDKETGRAYDSVEAWEKAQETLEKRYDSTAEFYEGKAQKEWARFKNAEQNGESDAEKWEHYRRSQEYYAKAQENRDKAAKIREKLGKEASEASGDKVVDMQEAGEATTAGFIHVRDAGQIPRRMPYVWGERLPRSGGDWDGEEGNSNFTPDDDVIPGDRNGTNPEGKSWEEIKKENNFDSIPFHDGEPDFSEVSKGNVEISDFTDDRSSNFDQADEKLAEQRGCTPEEVAQWRKENRFTWHECADCKTMQKVPTEVHGNIPHSGGVSRYKETHQNT